VLNLSGVLAQDTINRVKRSISIGTNFFPLYYLGQESIDQMGFVVSYGHDLNNFLRLRGELLINRRISHEALIEKKAFLTGFSLASEMPIVKYKFIQLRMGLGLIYLRTRFDYPDYNLSTINERYLCGPLARINFKLSPTFTLSTETNLSYGKKNITEINHLASDTFKSSHSELHFY